MTTRRALLQGMAAAAVAPAIPVGPIAITAEPVAAAAKAVQPLMSWAQLADWATENGYGKKELFFADGVEDYCEACGEHDRPIRAGTPMVCYRSSYEYEEYDTRCVQCMFDDTWFWENLTDAEIKKMLDA